MSYDMEGGNEQGEPGRETMDDTRIFKQMSRMSIFFLILYGLFLLGCGFLLGNFLIMLVIGALSILSAFLILVFQPRMRRRVQHRQEVRLAAVAGNTSIAPLAFPQPVPDEHALALPCTIKLRPTVSMALFIAGLFEVIWVGLLIGGMFFIEGSDATAAVFTTWTFGIIITLIAPSLLIFIIGLFAMRQRIEITDKGLTIHEMNSTSSVRWDEVKLFATTPPKRRASLIFYELSTSGNRLSSGVVLQQLRPGARLLPRKPETSLEEYDRQMDALLALIAARTGLPLYDLRG
jgi:hypothetical protein